LTKRVTDSGRVKSDACPLVCEDGCGAPKNRKRLSLWLPVGKPA
jgi:hypothetical protein